MVLALLKNKDILTILKEGIEMKKYDKEYSTQYTPEKNYLLSSFRSSSSTRSIETSLH